MQHGVDASAADNEVMAILSSPVQQKFVHKPQPRPGGSLAPATTGAVGPPSPVANGTALAGPNDYLLGEAAAGAVGGGGSNMVGAESGFVGGVGVVDATGGVPAPSPPHTPALPKATSASWDPQTLGSGSAFQVPAGKGGGGVPGGRTDGSGGVGGSMGSAAGFSALSMGGFRVVAGGDHGVFQVKLVGILE